MEKVWSICMPMVEVFSDIYSIYLEEKLIGEMLRNWKDNHVLCVKVKIIKVVYDQMHDARDSFSQWVDVRSYTWLGIIKNCVAKVVCESKRVSPSRSTHQLKTCISVLKHWFWSCELIIIFEDFQLMKLKLRRWCVLVKEQEAIWRFKYIALQL